MKATSNKPMKAMICPCPSNGMALSPIRAATPLGKESKEFPAVE